MAKFLKREALAGGGLLASSAQVNSNNDQGVVQGQCQGKYSGSTSSLALAWRRGHSAQVVQGQVQASQIRPVLGLRWSHVYRYPGKEVPQPLVSSVCICFHIFA